MHNNDTRAVRVQGGGLKPAFIQKMFRDSTSVEVLVRMLLIISQLARMARPPARGGAAGARVRMADNYQLIHESDFYGALKKLFSHRESQVRMRVCNLVGAPPFTSSPRRVLHGTAGSRADERRVQVTCAGIAPSSTNRWTRTASWRASLSAAPTPTQQRESSRASRSATPPSTATPSTAACGRASPACSHCCTTATPRRASTRWAPSATWFAAASSSCRPSSRAAPSRCCPHAPPRSCGHRSATRFMQLRRHGLLGGSSERADVFGVTRGAVQEVIEMGLGPNASNRLVQETALFSLGNMANHHAMAEVMQQQDVHRRVTALTESSHSNLRTVAQRLATKLRTWQEDVARSAGEAAGSQSRAAHAAAVGVENLRV